MTIRTASVYRLFFADALRDVRNGRAAYDAEVEDWYTNGDGASPKWVEAGTQDWFVGVEHDDPSRLVNIGGKGYRFPHCIHGMSLWTDYDNICGGCEDSLTDIQQAQGMARSEFNRLTARFDWLMAAPTEFKGTDPWQNLLSDLMEDFPKGK
jgi:hypothetical protein